MGKNPAFLFYPMDYLRDTLELSLAARGAWITILCKMWGEKERGKYRADITQMSRLLGCSQDVTKRIVEELSSRNICDLENHKDTMTIISRRMVREEAVRTASSRRQKKFRDKGGGDPVKWTATRVRILERDKYMCAYCGRKATTVDHLLPRTKGGGEEDFNLVACCKRCNTKKNNKTPAEANMRFWEGFRCETVIRHENNADITLPLSVSSSVSVSVSVSKDEDDDAGKVKGNGHVFLGKYISVDRETHVWLRQRFAEELLLEQYPKADHVAFAKIPENERGNPFRLRSYLSHWMGIALRDQGGSLSTEDLEEMFGGKK